MMEPNVRQMLVCEDARSRAGNPGKIDVFGLMNRATAARFPFNLSFAVYICLSNARGAGVGRIVVKNAASEEAVYIGDPHEFEFGNDPLKLHPFLVRVFSCRVPEPGLYSVEIVYNDVTLESCILLVEESK